MDYVFMFLEAFAWFFVVMIGFGFCIAAVVVFRMWQFSREEKKRVVKYTSKGQIMPVKKCTSGGKKGYKFGNSGKCFTGPGAKAKASKQGQAINASKAKKRK